MTTTKRSYSQNLALLSIGFILFIALIYQPLPQDFPQPWKYRVICFGSKLVTKISYVLENLNLLKRIEAIRLLYYISIGCFQIRNPQHQLKIYDMIVGNVSVRVYQPLEYGSQDLMPAIIHFHGGGFMIGCIDTYDVVTYTIANQTRAIVLSVEYRRIPEHSFPSALNDSMSVAFEIFHNALRYKIDINRIALAGDSAGGNLALVITQHLIRDGFKPKLTCLMYPVLQFFDFTLPSYQQYLPRGILGIINQENLVYVISQLSGRVLVTHDMMQNNHTSINNKQRLYPYLNPQEYLPKHYQPTVKSLDMTENPLMTKTLEYLTTPDISPLLVSDQELQKLPIILLFTAEFDILRDEGFIFAERLKRLNKQLYHYHFNSAFHGSHVLLNGPLKFDYAWIMIEKTTEAIRKYL